MHNHEDGTDHNEHSENNVQSEREILLKADALYKTIQAYSPQQRSQMELNGIAYYGNEFRMNIAETEIDLFLPGNHDYIIIEQNPDHKHFRVTIEETLYLRTDPGIPKYAITYSLLQGQTLERDLFTIDDDDESPRPITSQVLSDLHEIQFGLKEMNRYIEIANRILV